MANKPYGRFKLPNDDYTPVGDMSVLNKSIAEIGLSEETAANLQAVGISTLCDVAKCQMKHLYRIPKMGKKHVFEVLRKMQSYNLDFRRVERTADSSGNNNAANAPKRDKVNNARGNSDNTEQIQNNFNNDNSHKNFNKRSNDNRTGSRNNVNAPINETVKNERFGENKNNRNFREDRRDNRQIRERDTETTAPRRVRINSYDADSVNLSARQRSPFRKRTLKEERSLSIARKINSLQPLKNEDGMYKFFKQGKFGYKDEQGKIVIEPTYDEAYNFKEGLACVELQEQVGFINLSGDVVIPIVYDTACSFSEGLASVTKDEKCGYIDKEGNIVFDFIYESATSFENGISLVKKDGKWGYMDRNTGDIRLR